LQFIEYIRHLDKHLADAATQYGVWVYAIVAGIIFAETAVVIFPFLPGDSLLFAVGIVAANEANNISIPGMFILLIAAAIGGNVVNYWIGKFFGERAFRNPKAKVLNQKNLEKTHAFFENYGGKAIIITRFVPVVRALAPFVAGMGAMTFGRFMIYNVISAVAWVGVCMFAGIFLGGIPIVKERFELAILGLVILSVAPIAWEWYMHKKRAKTKAQSESTSE
jgi:membrane-associated protein